MKYYLYFCRPNRSEMKWELSGNHYSLTSDINEAHHWREIYSTDCNNERYYIVVESGVDTSIIPFPQFLK